MTPENEKSPDPRFPIPDTRSGGASDPKSEIQDHRSASGGKRKVVLAIASAGGHWIQLRRLHPAFAGTHLIYATTRETYRAEVEEDGAEFRVVPDCNRWQKFKLIKAAAKIFLLLLKEKPDVIISTGAAPGYFAIRLGKLLGKKTIWVDSIANAEELSLSGQKAGQHVDHWITQWKHLARPNGPHFYGNVLGDAAQEQIENQGSVISNQKSEDNQTTSQDHASVISNQGSPDVGQDHVSVISNPLPSGATLEEQSDKTSKDERTTDLQSPAEHSERSKIQDPRSAIERSERSKIPDPRSAIERSERSTIRTDRPKRIFVTVGTDLPFDRLVKTLDEWAPSHPNFEIYAQIGETSYKPQNIPFCHFIEPPEFKKRFRESDLVVSHAGMGTILSSLSYQKPLLVMPRIAAKGEHRNEHQLATAKHLQALNKINVAHDETELLTILESNEGLPVKANIGNYASSILTDKLVLLIAPQ